MTNENERKEEETKHEEESDKNEEVIGLYHPEPGTVVDGDEVVDIESTWDQDGKNDGNDPSNVDQENVADVDGVSERVSPDAPWIERYVEILVTFWPMGLIAFGGPPAHVAILRERLVEQRGWMDEEQFVELFAIGQGLPGPTSTQLVVSTAISRAGPVGGLSALVLWNFPGLIILTVCGILLSAYIDPNDPPFWLVGLPPAAISLVFKAFYDFTKNFDKLELSLSLFSHVVAILINGDERIPSSSSQYIYPAMLIVGGLVTLVDSKRVEPFSTYSSPSKGWDSESDTALKRIGIPMWVGAIVFLVWLLTLVLVICLVNVAKVSNVYLEIFELMFRVGSIIFGGGQVVIPLLQDEVVPKWMTKDQFLQGLGLTQSMPGPLFNFSAYLGAVYMGVPGALVAWLGIFGPGILLIFAAVPFWARLRHVRWFKSTLKGVNATAIGLVGAACVILWEAAINNSADAIVFSFAGFLAVVFGYSAPIVVVAGGILGAIMHEDVLNLGQESFCVANGYVEA